MGNLSFINVDEVEKQLEEKPQWQWMDDGEYKAIIIRSELKENKKQTGLVVEVHFKIDDGGKFDGRTLKEWFNVKHPSEKAQQIGQGQLSALSKACGFPTLVDDSDSLMLKSVVLVIEFTDDRGDGKPGNIIKGYKTTKSLAPKKELKHISFDDDEIPF